MIAARHDWDRIAAAAGAGAQPPGAGVAAGGHGDLSQAASSCHHDPFRHARMQGFVDRAWDALSGSGVSWIGFYLEVPGSDDSQRLVLGPRRDTPACSPIGLHGACGRCLVSGVPLVVQDVSELGANYIACDPRDRSELVVPCRTAGRVWGVLDVDSHRVGCFSDADAVAAARALAAWGLSNDGAHGPGPQSVAVR